MIPQVSAGKPAAPGLPQINVGKPAQTQPNVPLIHAGGARKPATPGGTPAINPAGSGAPQVGAMPRAGATPPPGATRAPGAPLAGAPRDGSTYYEVWLEAFEAFLADRGLAEARALGELTAAWRDAYVTTPHGQPVDLATRQK